MASLPYAEVDFSLRSMAGRAEGFGRFAIGGLNGPAADREVAKSGFIISEGDLFLNGAQPCTLTGFSEECLFHPSEFYPQWTMEAASDSLKAILQILTGWQSIHRPAEQAMRRHRCEANSDDEVVELTEVEVLRNKSDNDPIFTEEDFQVRCLLHLLNNELKIVDKEEI
ncbi:hypothetical protein DVH24_024071 [Malus domestica]|uniref:Uncharacterized protein n=1 Tax=Malus domestica TaxID=3750 RepID=A0A498JHV3_MALDO|nr:hypothetical protein DVH24_024071 [Malus domestica]